MPENRNEEKKPDPPAAPTAYVQTGHCGATGTVKNRVCLRVIPVKVFGKDKGREKITYAIRDEGSNTTLVKESQRIEFGRTANRFHTHHHERGVARIGEIPLPICSRFGTKGLFQNPKCSVGKVFVSRVELYPKQGRHC